MGILATFLDFAEVVIPDVLVRGPNKSIPENTMILLGLCALQG